MRRYGIDCEAYHVGTLHAGVGKAGLAELTEREHQWRSRGAPVELLDREAAVARMGTTAYVGALLDRRAGTIQPLAYARGLARAAVGNGARIFTSSPVTDLQRDGAGWRLVTPQGSAWSLPPMPIPIT